MLGLIFFVLIVLAFVSFPFFVKVGKVECSTQYGPCSENLVQTADGALGKSLFSAKSKLKKDLKGNFEVERFSTQYRIPSTLKVAIVIKKPVFALKSELSDEFDLVDLEGNVVGVSTSSSLPGVSTSEQLPKAGEKISGSQLSALKLIIGVYEMYQATFGKIENESLIVDLPSGLRVIFPLESSVDTDLLLGSLRLIESKIESDSPGKFREVDMRYKNPVLR
jgi:hypothetical protein